MLLSSSVRAVIVLAVVVSSSCAWSDGPGERSGADTTGGSASTGVASIDGAAGPSTTVQARAGAPSPDTSPRTGDRTEVEADPSATSTVEPPGPEEPIECGEGRIEGAGSDVLEPVVRRGAELFLARCPEVTVVLDRAGDSVVDLCRGADHLAWSTVPDAEAAPEDADGAEVCGSAGRATVAIPIATDALDRLHLLHVPVDLAEGAAAVGFVEFLVGRSGGLVASGETGGLAPVDDDRRQQALDRWRQARS